MQNDSPSNNVPVIEPCASRIRIVPQDLFMVDASYHLAHCISADFKMGAGIALEFRRRFSDLARYAGSVRPGQHKSGTCVAIGRTLNLITKERYFHKPTYGLLKCSLLDMRRIAVDGGIGKIAMPRIGCGLDKLKWDKVLPIIEDVFAATGIEILVCLDKPI